MLYWLLGAGMCFLSMDQLSPSVLPGQPLESVSCHPVLFFQSTQQDNMAPVEIMKKIKININSLIIFSSLYLEGSNSYLGTNPRKNYLGTHSQL
jgi:hypothetical protein